MEINKALELGLEWAEKRMASELTEMDKEYILIGIKASLVKNCSIPDVVRQSEQLCDHTRSERSYIGQNMLRCNKCGKEFS